MGLNNLSEQNYDSEYLAHLKEMISLFEEAIGSTYDEIVFAPPECGITQSEFYKRLVKKRARRANIYGGCFINDRGYRHIKKQVGRQRRYLCILAY